MVVKKHVASLRQILQEHSHTSLQRIETHTCNLSVSEGMHIIYLLIRSCAVTVKSDSN